MIQFIQHIPNAKHIHNTKGAVVKTVTGTNFAGTFIPQMSAVIGTNVTFKTAVVIGFQNFQNACVTVAIPMACFGEVTVFKMFYISNMRKGNAAAVLANNFSNIVIGVSV